jgi:mitochondrial fission protein ELM1
VSAAPRTWLVLGDKPGDNRQVEIIAERLPWPVERRNVIPKPEWAFNKPRVRPTLTIFDAAKSDELRAPWPDLILTIGRRPSSAALWIRVQNGGRTRIVLVGKPSGAITPYDLVIASAEQFLPPLPSVMTIGLPLMRVDPGAVAAAEAEWAPRFAGLPRPWLAVLLGGPTGPFLFDEPLAHRVLAAVREHGERQGGTAFVVTSRRTPKAVVDRLRDDLPANARLFAWGDAAAGNPYAALLGLADAALVTADSISMQTEVARQGMPLAIVPLAMRWWGGLDRRRRQLLRQLSTGPLKGIAHGLARLGMPMQIRDFEAFQDGLVAKGLASRGLTPPSLSQGAAGDELEAVVRRIEEVVANPSCRSSPARSAA